MPRGRPKKIKTEENKEIKQTKAEVKSEVKAVVKPVEKKKTVERYIFAIGRRKTAVARIFLYPVSSESTFTVNNKPVAEYFNTPAADSYYLEPFKITNFPEGYKVVVKVEGSGSNGQLKAVIHGLSRAIELVDKEKYRPLLKKHGLLTRDPRERERRKVGTGGRARRQKQSPKR